MKFRSKSAALAIIFSFISSAVPAFAFPVQALQAKIRRDLQQGLRPVGVFDLDETLLHSTQRKVLSYRAALERNVSNLQTQYPEPSRILLSTSAQKELQVMTSLANEYDSKAWLSKLGIVNESFRLALDQATLPIYLSPEYMQLDRAVAGAKAIVSLFYQAGGDVYFVSSRYRTRQYDPTLRRLILSSLYASESHSHLLLRDDSETSIGFKIRAFNQIRQSLLPQQKVILVAENEPENLNAMMQAFPDAVPVFVVGAVMNTSIALETHPRLVRTKTFMAGD